MKFLIIQAALAALFVPSAGAVPTSEPTPTPDSTPAPKVQGPETQQQRFAKVNVDVPTGEGKITGKSRLGVEVFNGIPFADPPVGPLRLKPPRRLSRKLGNVDATGFAPACPQMFVSSELNGQEDCLTVDVARPEGTKAGDKLPVLFWIYGGGFELGSTNSYDATSLLATARKNKQPFVYVAVNYRVAGFGFMPGKEILRDGSSNLGLLDQRMGLEWVADNIEAFGGDPSKVTIWGESAGAISVYNQMLLFGGNASYHGKPLFRGAIMNSGSSVPADPVDCPKGQAVYDFVVEQAGCSGAEDTLKCLRELPYETFLRASTAPPGILSYTSVALSYLPRPDGKVLEDSPDKMTEKGRYHAVPFIIGDQEDEGTIFSIFQTNVTTADKMADYLHQYLFHNAPRDKLKEYVDLYEPALLQGGPFRTGILNELYPGFKRVAAILADVSFLSTRRTVLKSIAKVKPDVPAWSYLSSYFYGTPVVGTFHGSDILHIFYGILPSHAMKSCRTYYFNFLYNLDPNKGVGGYAEWPQWKDNNDLMWFKSFFNNKIIKDDFRSGALGWLEKHGDILRI
ncbi:carboxylesterase family protein [Hirsutella rhossiliensis]|uniref:Carboxylic ester hydrolase n=1 Tax=Hirsutella rhossiliensis TaxID=111463 RepID=A0A9P8N5Q4_9HYPO|nr:carboxylesterase family domain-containing protein [Hirsutella rhossiliensis]KAH0967425.1 carboxylesterase family domain-containing protein [Hirsutella rhossiliensis]